MLVALSPENEWEFLTAMAQAWEWTQARSRFYAMSGARMTFEEFLAFSKAENKKQIAVMSDGKMAALVTVWLMSDGQFDVHVIAPRKSSSSLLTAALIAVRDGIFDDLDADVIKTSCGTYRGHRHKGLARILMACGMTPTGDIWYPPNNDGSFFDEYEITRRSYVKSKTSTN